MKILKNRVMEISSMVSTFFNHDYDGDSMIAIALHSEQARDDFKFMFINNNIEFEHRDDLLITLEHEAIYSAYMITYLISKVKEAESQEILSFETYKEFKDQWFTFENLKNSLYTPIKINIKNSNITQHPISILINVSLQNFDWTEDEPLEIFYDEFHPKAIFSKKNLMNFLYTFFKNLPTEEKKEFYTRVHELDKFFLEFGTVLTDLNPSFDLDHFSVNNEEIQEYKKNLIQVEPYLAFQQNMILFNDYIMKSIEIEEENILKKVYDSGARLKSVQLLKAASNTGIPTDIYGKAFAKNIGHSLLDGLTQEEYFQTGDSARLALMQRQDAIPKGGELQRKFFFSTGILKFNRELDDCQANIPIKDHRTFKIEIQDKDHLKSLNHRYYKENKDSDEIKKIDLDVEDFSHLIGKEIEIYSPITCQAPDYQICKRCMGEKQPRSKHIGAALGSYIAESIIQSVLRTHHFGGAFITEEKKDIQKILKRNKIQAPDTIIFSKENESDIQSIENYLNSKYKEGDIELIKTEDTEGNIHFKINVIQLPHNDDSVKILNQIVSLIDKNRDETDLIPINEVYNQLVPIIRQNNILSVYFELIVSLLFYDEDNILFRYSDKEPIQQIALKNIIENIDPKLSIFYNFNNRAISNVYKKQFDRNTSHMYDELLKFYY